MLETRCHCGRVSMMVPRRARVLTACNCSLCRRIKPLFAYYKAMSVKVQAAANNTNSYTWGHHLLRWHRCRGCGCFTHHEPVRLRSNGGSRLGINMALVTDLDRLTGITVKLRDGAADTWAVIDEFRFGTLLSDRLYSPC